jgi:hypothetical protein
MNSELHFNMANAHSSAPYHPDDSQAFIPHPAIPAHIRYICQNVFHYFCKRPIDNDKDNVLSSFTHQYTQKLEFFLKNSLLYWLEVTGQDITVNNLHEDSLLLWESSAEIQPFLTQVQIFIECFRFGFAHNPPHIYISALPFLPPHSLISIYYHTTYPHSLNVKYNQEPQKKTINSSGVVKGSFVAAISRPDSIELLWYPVPKESISQMFPASVLNVYDTRQKGRSLEVFSIPLPPVKLLNGVASETPWI